MSEETLLKKLFVFLVLLLLVLLRWFCWEDTNVIIGFIGYAGLVFSGLDLYWDLSKRYKKKDRFNCIRGVAIVFALILAGLCVYFIFKKTISSKCSDIFTILALMVSLPKDLYLFLIGKYINKGEIYDGNETNDK